MRLQACSVQASVFIQMSFLFISYLFVCLVDFNIMYLHMTTLCSLVYADIIMLLIILALLESATPNT